MNHKPTTLPLIALAALAIERIVLSAWIPLIPQEAYYWMYAKHPDMSYFDHPPMVAWIIRLGTTIFGNNEFGVRCIGQLLMLGSLVILYRITRMLYGRRTSLIAVSGLMILPLYFHIGWLATMDSALVFFWLVAMRGFLIAIQQNDYRGWYLAGVGAGAAMLSKYTGVFCLTGMFLAMLLHQPWRSQLRRPGFWLMCCGAMAAFSPVILWNYSHQWASFRFQTVGRFTHPINPWVGISAALASQAAVVMPLAVVAIAVIAMHLHRTAGRIRREPATRRFAVTVAFSLPLLAVLAAESLRTAVHINWAAPACLSLLAPAAQHLRMIWRVSTSRPAARVVGRWVAAVSLGCCVAASALLPYVALVSPKAGLLAYDFGPWPALANQIHQAEEQLERESGREPVVVADGPFELASEIAFYRAKIDDDVDEDDADEHRDPSTGKIIHVTGEAPPFKTTTSQWFFGKGPGNAFPFWMDKKDWFGADVIYVTAYTDVPQEIRSQTDSAQLVRLPYLGGKRHYNLLICRNFHA